MASVMTEQPLLRAAQGLIDGDYAVDFDVRLSAAAGGHVAYAAQSVRAGAGFMAVQVELGWPARARALAALANAPISAMLTPLAHGAAPMPSGDVGYFVVCAAPLGRPLSVDLRPWGERELLDALLRPAAAALADLHARDTTHRSIRLDNLFRAASTDPVTLGCAWAAPPASRQNCRAEPPYVAMCLPAGRGDGSGADDIYALGVALVTLALGRDPLEGVEDEAIIRRKLDLGSYDAIVGRHRLPTAIAELARGMLADDPEHRPSAVLLGDPPAARARRPPVRPPRQGQRPFPLGEAQAWTARDLALGIMGRPDLGAQQLRNGAVALWLRRGLGDGAMAGRIDELCGARDEASHADQPRADSLLATRAVAVLNPLAPLSWRRLNLWPDGLGAALNQALHTDAGQAAALAELAAGEVPHAFGLARAERTDTAALQAAARQVRTALGQRQPEQGALRLNYALNPLAPCESPLLAGRFVVRLGDLLPALEAAAAGPLRATLPPVDRHIVAFVSMRRDERGPADIGQLAALAGAGDALAQLRLLARLQLYTQPGKLPALTAWMADLVAPAAAAFRSHSRRTQLAEQLAAMAQEGLLAPLAALLDDPAKLRSDRSGYEAAVARYAAINAALGQISSTNAPRVTAALHAAQEVTSGVSLAVCGLALAAAAFL